MFKEYRKLRGYTQEQLAELVEISWRQLNRIENETSIPTLETFKKLIDILKIKDKDIIEYLTIKKREVKNDLK